MNQHQKPHRVKFLRNAALAALVAGGIWYYMQPPAHKASANPQAEILEIGIANAASYQISMWVLAGSTSDSVPGIAHVVEHLKFKANDGSGFVAFNAIPGSSSNAATTYDSTRYDLYVPPEGVDKALETLSTIVLPMKISEADLKLEKTIVQQELLQRSQSDPDTPFFQAFFAKLYHDLPYEHSPGGTQESVASVSLKNVLDFDAAHYSGSKVFLSISGPELSAAHRRTIERVFPGSAIARISVARNLTMLRDDAELLQRPVLLPPPTIPLLLAEEISAEKISPRARSIKMSFAKIISAPTEWKSVVAAGILRSAVVSRLPDGLHDLISEERQLVQSWSFSVDRLFEGVWQINFSADVENGVDPKDVQLDLETYLTKLAETGLSPASFERLKARNFLVSEWENAGARANELADSSLHYGYDKAISYMDSLRNAKIEDVNALLKLLQRPGRVGVALLKPEGVLQ